MLVQFARLASMAAGNEVSAVKSRVLRSVLLGMLVLMLGLLALGFALAALVIWLQQQMDTVPALLLVAAGLLILCLLVALLIRQPARPKPRNASLGLLTDAEGKPLTVNPLTVAATALAIGLLVGRRGPK
jgi:uncharacterized membrane protein YqjE